MVGSVFLLQSFRVSCAMETQSNGFSSHQDNKEKPKEEGPTGPQLLGTGRPQALLGMFTPQITRSLEWRKPWFSIKAKLQLDEKPNGRWMSTEPLKQITQLPLPLPLVSPRYVLCHVWCLGLNWIEKFARLICWNQKCAWRWIFIFSGLEVNKFPS